MHSPESPLNVALSSIFKFPSSMLANPRALLNPLNALRFYRVRAASAVGAVRDRRLTRVSCRARTQNRRMLRSVVLDVIAYRRAQRAGASSGRFEALGDRLRREKLLHTLPNGCLDFVEMLDEAHVSDQKIADEVFTFIVAGHETTVRSGERVAWRTRARARARELRG